MRFFTLTGLVFILSLPATANEFGLAPRVTFNFNRSELNRTAVDLIQKNSEWLRVHPESVIILEGHADEWGDNDYNLRLGDLRAREVKYQLILNGIDPERVIMVVSLGESKPLDPNQTFEAWALNRRVEFVVR